MISDVSLPPPRGVTNLGQITAVVVVSLTLVGGLAVASRFLPEEKSPAGLEMPRYQLSFENTLLVDTQTGEVFKVEPDGHGGGRWVRQIAPPTARTPSPSTAKTR